jgi:hypothetical protein
LIIDHHQFIADHRYSHQLSIIDPNTLINHGLSIIDPNNLINHGLSIIDPNNLINQESSIIDHIQSPPIIDGLMMDRGLCCIPCNIIDGPSSNFPSIISYN